MKISVVTSSISRNAGGIYDAVRLPLKILIKNPEIDVKVFSLKDKYTLEDEGNWFPISTQTYKSSGPKAFGYSPQLSNGLKKYNSDMHHDHGLWMYPSFASYSNCKKMGKPYVISPHGMLDGWALRQSSWKKKLIRSLFEDIHLNSASCINALTIKEATDVKQLGIKNPICVIPNGIDLPINDECLESKCPFDLNRKNLLFIGRIHPKKGLFSLLKAWGKLKEDKKSDFWHLNIAGWDQMGHESELKQFVYENGLNDTVTFLGPLYGAEKETALKTADAFILPSLSEGLPMTILEAWSYSLPVIMTPECNLSDAFECNAAIKVNTRVDSILTGLHHMIELNEEDLLRIGSNGRNLVEQKYSWSNIVKEMMSVYKWVLGGGSRPDSIID